VTVNRSQCNRSASVGIARRTSGEELADTFSSASDDDVVGSLRAMREQSKDKRVSDLDTRPQEYLCAGRLEGGPEELLLTARRVPLGRTTEVARALPDRQIRMIGAWCFLDHYGPEDVSGLAGMQVWAHPHTGLQTVSWLFDGEIEHRDSLGSQVMVRPGELNIMTAGHGIVHSEISQPDKPPMLHGVQLWVALPDAIRDREPAFESYADLPDLIRPGVAGKVLIGEVDGASSPALGYFPLCGAELRLDPGADVVLSVQESFEYGIFAVAGAVIAESTTVEIDQLLYLGDSRRSLHLRSPSGGRVIMLGGQAFAEDLVMWWNFIGRSHAEIIEFRSAWEERDVRFPPIVDRSEKVMEAPPMPTVQLKPRPRRSRAE
jgi:quercetin 2,3-dioxygenase